MYGYIGSKNGNTKQNIFNLQNNNIFASRSEKVGTKYREIKFWFREYCKVQHLKQWLVGKKKCHSVQNNALQMSIFNYICYSETGQQSIQEPIKNIHI